MKSESEMGDRKWSIAPMYSRYLRKDLGCYIYSRGMTMPDSMPVPEPRPVENMP